MTKYLFGFPVKKAKIKGNWNIKFGNWSKMNRILNNAEWQKPTGGFFVIVDGREMYKVRLPDEKEQQE